MIIPNSPEDGMVTGALWCLSCIVGDLEDHWYFVSEAWLHVIYHSMPNLTCSYAMVNLAPEGEWGGYVFALFKLMAKVRLVGYRGALPKVRT